MFTHGRPAVTLDGTWKFCPDPMHRCRQQKWWANPSQPDAYFPCWDADGLWDIQVPGTWNTQFEELKWYYGESVYMREFDLPAAPDADQEAFLAFDGALYSCTVYLNGNYVGTHEWGYSPFQLRVTGMLAETNRLFVLVENEFRDDRVPGPRFDWNNDGGLINSVKLVFVPRTHIENFRTATRLDGADVVIDVDVWLRSRNPAATENVAVRIPELGLAAEVCCRTDEPGHLQFTAPRDRVALWHPDNPRLYRIELATRHETIADDIGFREIKTQGRRILLNGDPIRLYGISVHSEFKETGRTATPAGIDMMVARAKELGVNFLRCAHYPYADIFARAMDRAGLLWWEEVPAYWLLNMAQPDQTRRACGMMRETVCRDWNRAGLIVWSVSNECCYMDPEDPTHNNYDYWRQIVPMVRELDPSRLLSCAEAQNFVVARPIWDPKQADEFHRRQEDVPYWRPGHTDEWYAMFDILSANFYPRTREEMEAVFSGFVHTLAPYEKPLMLSEFGGQSLRGATADPDLLGSEQRHAAILRDAYDIFKTLPEIVGLSPWCLVDVRVPQHWRWYNDGKAVFRYGFCDENWKPKAAFHALKECIADLKAAHGHAAAPAP